MTNIIRTLKAKNNNIQHKPDTILGILAQSVEHWTGNQKKLGVRIPGMSNLSGYRMIEIIDGCDFIEIMTVANACLSFYAEVQSNNISRSLSQRNNSYFQSKEQ